MTHAKLREAAEAASKSMPPKKRARWFNARTRFQDLANPAAVLALLDEIAEKDATITRLEAELSAARAGLEEATGLIGLFRNFALSGVHFAYPLGSLQQLEAFLAPRSRQAAITGGE